MNLLVDWPGGLKTSALLHVSSCSFEWNIVVVRNASDIKIGEKKILLSLTWIFWTLQLAKRLGICEQFQFNLILITHMLYSGYISLCFMSVSFVKISWVIFLIDQLASDAITYLHNCNGVTVFIEGYDLLQNHLLLLEPVKTCVLKQVLHLVKRPMIWS